MIARIGADVYGFRARASGAPRNDGRMQSPRSGGQLLGTASMAEHVVAPVDEIPPGTRKLVEVGGRAVVVFNLGGEFYALNNRCPHRGGSLFHGIQTGLVES